MSSALDDDTRETLSEGRAAIRDMLRSAQKDLQKVFIVFLVGFLGTFYALRTFIWDYLKGVTEARMRASVSESLEIIAQTPFDVILLQAKIGLGAGIVLAIPPLLYFSRDALRRRGWWPSTPVARWKLAVVGLLAGGLFIIGAAYGYAVFFPFMFQFLASNALAAGIQPRYSIVKWAEFIGLLTLSFGLAAQMPLIVPALSYAEIVPYETFRDKWRYAVAGIFVFGAFFSPPDPFTQIMWAVPLIVLYGASLYLAKVVVTARRGSEQIEPVETARIHWNKIAGLGLLAGALTYGYYMRGGVRMTNDLLASIGSSYRVITVGPATATAFAIIAALIGVCLGLAYFVYRDLEPVGATEPTGDPTAIDLDGLDAEGVRAAPEESFLAIPEAEAVAAANRALEADEPAKARAILERWDKAREGNESTERESGPPRDLLAGEQTIPAALRRGAGLVDWRARWRAAWNLLAGVGVLVFAVGYAAVERQGVVNGVLTDLGVGRIPDIPAVFGVSPTVTLALFAVGGAVTAGLLAGVIALYVAYRAGTDPRAIDIEVLSADQVQRAPVATFIGLSERRANYLADRALAAGQEAKARAILDRWDGAQAAVEARKEQESEDDDLGDRASRASSTFLSGMTDGESDEEEIGGYFDDVVFIVNSLRSRAFRIVAVFGLVTAGTFAWLYSGGIGDVRQDFVDRLPPEVVGPEAENFVVIALHPVEALIFEVKVSTLLGAVAALPLVAYYAWPALRERGFVRGRREVVFGWTGALVAGLLGGFVLGYSTIAPAVISYLVGDALGAGIIISYRISDFFWLVIFTTIGIGFLADIPVLMVLLNSAGVSYQAMRNRWREVTITLLTLAAFFTPADIITLFVVMIPLMGAYGIGLLVLFVVTLGGRRNLSTPTVGAPR